jgi:GT2 family glycosyltransferase
VVVTYNSALLVTRCLDSLFATIEPEDEVLVIDNASTDCTPLMIADSYAWVRLDRSEENLGFGGACNRAAARARGRYLVFLNPDTEPQPGWLAALLAPLDAAPETTLVTAKLLLPGQPYRVDTFGNAVHISGITTCRGWGSASHAYTRLEEVSAVSGACFAMTAALFQRLGGFDGRLFMYFEDTDLSLRARLAGCRCMAVPDAVVLHNHTPGFSPTKLRYLERNRWWSLLKVYRRRNLVALAPVLLVSECLAWSMAAHGGWRHVVAKTLAWVDIIRWLPHLAPARAAIQRTRAVTDRELWRMHGTRLPFAQVTTGALGRLGEQVAWILFGTARGLVNVFARG